MAPVLETVGLEKHFGGLTAVAGLSLKIEKGARHALIGPNGAGKTTVINLLTGVLRPSSGRILLEGADITSLESYRRVRRGRRRAAGNQAAHGLVHERAHTTGEGADAVTADQHDDH